MPRMRSNVAQAGLPLALALMVALAAPALAPAELIQPPGGRTYPDIAASITGTQSYTYDPATGTGTFEVNNTPFLIKTGPGTGDEADVGPDSDGVRAQAINLTLDQNGNLVGGANNTYSLYGRVVVGGQTFNGLLLQGIPTSFGAQSGGAPAFNLDLKITGGLLASSFGPDAYMEIHPALSSTFDGNFAKDFTTTIESSNTLGTRPTLPAPIPEPSTLVVLLACGAGLILHRNRLRRPGSRLARSSSEIGP